MATNTIGSIPDSTSLAMVQGQTFSFTMTVTNADDTARDLTGYFAHMQFRSKQSTTSQLITNIDSVNDSEDPEAETDITIDAANGILTVRIPATTTAIITDGSWYDLFLINTTDATDAMRMMYGPCTVSASVTTTGSAT